MNASNMKNNVLVVPSNRKNSLETFLSAWAPKGSSPWDHIVVVWDGDTTPDTVEVLCADHNAHVIDRSKFADNGFPRLVFSRGSSACRCAGYLYAMEHLSPEVIYTLDDDCLPVQEDKSYIVREHRKNLFNTPCWESTVPGYRVRGIPYGNQGIPSGNQTAYYGHSNNRPKVMLSVGLWSGSPDLDAATELHRMTLIEAGDPIPPMPLPLGPRVMSRNVVWPMSSMNMAWRVEFTPAMIMPPSGDGQVYDRFEDIWCGLLVQRVLKAHNWHATVGTPLVLHSRASDTFANLQKEAAGVRLNECLWILIENLDLQVDRSDASIFKLTTQAMKMLADSLAVKNGYPASHPRGVATFTADWAKVILDWLKLLQSTLAC